MKYLCLIYDDECNMNGMSKTELDAFIAEYAAFGEEARASGHYVQGEADDARANDAQDLEDDRLRLIFTCCHPALPADAQVALTLREPCGGDCDARWPGGRPRSDRCDPRARRSCRLSSRAFRPRGALPPPWTNHRRARPMRERSNWRSKTPSGAS